MESDINLHVVLVVAFVKKGDRYLISRRSYSDKQAGGQWSTPGGKVDVELGDNIIENTLKKEIREEVGTEVENKISYVGSDAFIRSSGHHVVTLVFVADWKSGEARPLEDQAEVKWMTIQEIFDMQDCPDYLRKRVQMINENNTH